jgi:hypothetical protein
VASECRQSIMGMPDRLNCPVDFRIILCGIGTQHA